MGNRERAMSRVVQGIVSLIPYKLRLAFYHIPLISSATRSLLRKTMPSRAVVKITAGLMKGYDMEVDLKCEKFYWLGTYEPAVQETMKKIIEDGWVCYDIGAHIGYFSLLMARLTRGKVFAFEPEPQNFRLLKKHAEINRLSEIVIPVPLAVSSKTGFAFLKKGRSSFTGRIRNSAEVDCENNRVRVKATALDHFVYVGGNPEPNFVKIDVEGFEGKVLEGAKRVLQETRPVVLCEIHNREQGWGTYRILSEQGYLVFDVEKELRRLTAPKLSGHILACHRTINLLDHEK